MRNFLVAFPRVSRGTKGQIKIVRLTYTAIVGNYRKCTRNYYGGSDTIKTMKYFQKPILSVRSSIDTSAISLWIESLINNGEIPKYQPRQHL
jgi:hypothetical protein